MLPALRDLLGNELFYAFLALCAAGFIWGIVAFARSRLASRQ